VGVAAAQLADDLVVGGGAHRDDGVGHAQAVGQPAGGADADEARRAQLDQLAVVDGGAGAAHAGRLHAERLALVRAGEAQLAAFLVHQPGAGVEERLRDVLGAARIAGHQHGGGVVGGFGSDVDRHGTSVELAR